MSEIDIKTLADNITLVPSDNWSNIKAMDFDGCSVFVQGTFGDNTNLSSVTNGTLANTYAIGMFSGCTALTSFSLNCSALTNASSMFRKTDFVSFTQDLPDLTNGDYMFADNGSLVSFSGKLDSLTDGSYMFYKDNKLNVFSSSLNSLVSGNSMFASCSALTVGSLSLPQLETANNMFDDCKNLGSLTLDMPNCISAEFICSYARGINEDEQGLLSFKGNMPSAQLLRGAWQYCTDMVTFSAKTSGATDLRYSWKNCSSMTEWHGSMKSVTQISWDTFDGCTALTDMYCEALPTASGVEVNLSACPLNVDSLMYMASVTPTGKCSVRFSETTKALSDYNTCKTQLTNKGYTVV